MAEPLPQEFIDAVLMRGEGAPGSPADEIARRFPELSWSGAPGTMAPGMNAIPETDDEAYSGMDKVGLQHFWRNLPALTNEAGAAAWMKAPGFMSQNVEDRRNQTNLDVARGMIQEESDDLSGLSPQDYISRVIGGMYNNDFYLGPGAENYHLVPGMAPRDFDQADFYPMRKVSR